ncbi:hypothetical protein P8T57_17670 [Thalassospira sp. SN3W]|uniref:hypothetical protein n=1 Tax=Thalassospira sp. SN3W TaxID=3035476 RepID=UPI00311AFBC8
MKLPDFTPLILLSTGAITGALCAALFFPNTVPLPDGWGDVLGSSLGVAGAFYIARTTFWLEYRTKTKDATKPLLTHLYIALAGVHSCKDALQKNQEVLKGLAKLYQSCTSEKTKGLLHALKKFNTPIPFTPEHQQLFDEADDTFKTLRAAACNDIDHIATYSTSRSLPEACQAVQTIKMEFIGHLEPNEIMWLSTLIESLEKAEETDINIANIIHELTEISPTSPPDDIKNIRYKLELMPAIMIDEMTRQEDRLIRVIKRLAS